MRSASPRILVAEPDPALHPLFRACLADLGARSEVVATAEDALARLATTRFPIVIADWELLADAGRNLCERLRRLGREPRRRILLVVPQSEAARLAAALPCGGADLIVQPLQPELLALRLRLAWRMVALEDAVSCLNARHVLCSYCRKIDGPRGWQRLDTYLASEGGVRFSHGVCPTCHAAERSRWLDEDPAS